MTGNARREARGERKTLDATEESRSSCEDNSCGGGGGCGDQSSSGSGPSLVPRLLLARLSLLSPLSHSHSHTDMLPALPSFAFRDQQLAAECLHCTG